MKIRRIFLMIIFFTLPVIAQSAAAKEIVQGIQNPHWNKNACLDCHTEIPKDGRSINLKFSGDIINLCNSCHGTISKEKYIHATGMVPEQDKMGRMPDEFKMALKKDSKGRVTCVVCHELKYQCLDAESYRKENNPRFFRGGPYASRTDICFNCHDTTQYVMLNPHDQITDEGDLNLNLCSYCHDRTPNRRKVKSIRDVQFRVDKDYERICIRCHKGDVDLNGCIMGINGKVINHIVKPSQEFISEMEKADKSYILPLEPAAGKIFCGTCHNPHEMGVQRNPRADKGADAHRRLRMDEKERCTACHGENFNPIPMTSVKQ